MEPNLQPSPPPIPEAPQAVIILRMMLPGRATKPIEETLDGVIMNFRVEALRWKVEMLKQVLTEAQTKTIRSEDGNDA